MDTNRIRYFCAIARAGSLAAAAKSLALSPAALSKSMRLLQEELGYALFQQSGRGIVVTKEGLRFAEKGALLLKDVDALPDYAKGSSSPNTVRLGGFEVFTTYFLGELCSDILAQHDVLVHELLPGELEQALREDRIDLGLTYLPIPHHEIDHLEVSRVQMGIFGIKKFNAKPFESLPFVVPIEPLHGVPTKAQGLDGWREEFGRRKIQFKVALMESALELCRRGLAVAYLPKFVVDLHNRALKEVFQLHEMPHPKKITGSASVYLVKRKSDMESRLAKKIAQKLRAIL